jgi:hypothetical protein
VKCFQLVEIGLRVSEFRRQRVIVFERQLYLFRSPCPPRPERGQPREIDNRGLTVPEAQLLA